MTRRGFEHSSKRNRAQDFIHYLHLDQDINILNSFKELVQHARQRIEIRIMSEFRSIMNQRFSELTLSERKIINEVWRQRTKYIQWPTKARLLWPGCVRIRYHKIPDEIKEEARSKGVQIDARSNGPAIMSFLLAGGKRPKRSNNQGWHVDHIYDGKFPWAIDRQTLHAVKDGKHFTQSAGLITIHPIAEALRDEYFYFAWLLRHEAFVRFNYDPDIVFCKKIGERGFKVS